MIKVTKENKYKVLKPELFKEGETLLGKYPLFWTNTAMTPTHICFVKSFGTKDDIVFGTSNTTWLGFNPESNELKLHCTSYGGLAGFVFSEEDLKRKDLSLSKNDIDCMKFTITLIENLQEQGIIEVEE
ncbi:MAG: hypothetical protein E6987_01735 [Peptoniphilus harei]|nr:hypothetical protein [Peptoniphilus harei]